MPNLTTKHRTKIKKLKARARVIKTLSQNGHLGFSVPPVKVYGVEFKNLTLAIGVAGLVASAALLFLRFQTMGLPSKIILLLFASGLFTLPTWANSIVTQMIDFRGSLKNFVSVTSEFFDDWYDNQLSLLFQRDRLLIYAVLFIAAGLALGTQQQWSLSLTQEILLLIFGAVVLAVSGIGIYIEQRLLAFFRGIPTLEIKFFQNQEPSTGVRQLTSLSFKLVAWWTWFILLAETAAFMIPFFSNTFVAVLIPLGAVPSLLLLAAQFGIHEAMVKDKRRLVNDFSKHIKPAFDLVSEKPTLENVSRFKILNEIQQQMDKLPEWSFDYKSIVAVIVTLVFPIILTVAFSWLKYYGIVNP